MGAPFREAEWEVIDVDWDGRYGAEIQTDITTWDYAAAFEPGYFDVIWASPDCTQYSRATQQVHHVIWRRLTGWSRPAAPL